MAVYRRGHFNAAHRIFNPDWSDEKNSQVFGACANPYYHGHNYELEVKIVGSINEETGYVFDLKQLGDLMKEHVEEYLDHKNLNIQVPEFKSLIPSAENIAYVIYQKLRAHIGKEYELYIKLWETPRNYVEYPVA